MHKIMYDNPTLERLENTFLNIKIDVRKIQEYTGQNVKI